MNPFTLLIAVVLAPKLWMERRAAPRPPASGWRPEDAFVRTRRPKAIPAPDSDAAIREAIERSGVEPTPSETVEQRDHWLLMARSRRAAEGRTGRRERTGSTFLTPSSGYSYCDEVLP